MPDVVTVTESQGQRYTWGSGGFTWSSASAGKSWDTAYPAVYAFGAAVDLSFLEVAARQTTKPSNEAFGMQEAARRLFSIAKAEPFGMVETYSDLIAYVLRWVESIGLSENLSKANRKEIGETLATVDQLAKLLDKALSSSIAYVDSLTRQSTLRPSEFLPLSDVQSKNVTKVTTESFNYSDQLTRRFGKEVAEAISLAETYADLIAYIIRISESVSFSETAAKQSVKPLLESFGTTDSSARKLIKRVAEAMAVAELFGRTVAYRKSLNEGLSVSEAIKRASSLNVKEALALAEQYRRHANGVISDMIISVLAITEDDFKNIVENGHPPGYTNFRDFIQGDYTYQRALFRAILKSSNADRGYIDALRLTVDVPDIFDRGVAEVTNATAGVTVQFSRTFRFTPQVTITHKGGTTTAIPRLLGTPSTVGFTAVLEDQTGARVTGSFSWLAQGC
jgi:hypothetical protein